MKRVVFGVSVALALMLVASSASAVTWVQYKSSKYGVAMKLPAGTQMAASEVGGGWAALAAKFGPAKLFAVTKLGVQASPAQIEAFGMKLTGIAGNYWKMIAQGKGEHGWTWYRIYQASNSTHVVWAVLGTGAKGSYLMLLWTTVADATAHTADYKTWAYNVVLF
ncbi:MAG: hypothetical protein KC609_10070 [Myxococcales bacterium]|nr:hypothetical protein [Myxococcales bacterium]